ncbi:MAG: Lcl C-terminal domain-containing protein [Thermochromatium sp.]
MRYPIRVVLTVSLLIPLASSPLRAQEDAPIPPATDACLKGKIETTPSTEFNLLEGGAVVRHQRTGLEWQRCSLGQRWDAKSNGCVGRPTSHTWTQAMQLAARAQDGWRLPTGEELLTIVEKCHFSPAINPQVFPNTPSGLYWSSSVDTGGLDRAWSVSLFSGQYFRAGKSQPGRVRLVRGTLKPAGG